MDLGCLVSLWVFLNGADLCVNCYKVMLCNSSGECPNSDISLLLLSGYDNSVVLYVREKSDRFWFVGVERLFVTVMDISRPCQPEKLIPLLP